MSNFYKIIHIDNIQEIQQELINIFPNDYHGKSEIFAIKEMFSELPETRKLLESFDLSERISYFEFMVMQPGWGTGIHVDFDDFVDNDDFEYSFNIPLTDCNETYMSFYKATRQHSTSYYTDSITKKLIYYKYYGENDCEIVESFIIKEPYIFSTDNLHNLVNNSSKEQIIVLFRIFRNANDVVKKLLQK